MALFLLVLAIYISRIFHVVCASFSALATRELADANPFFWWNMGLSLQLILYEMVVLDESYPNT